MANGNGGLNKYLGSIITVLVIIVGLATNWGAMSISMDHMETRLTKSENEVHLLQTEVATLRLNQVRDNETLQSIKQTMEEIKRDLRAFREDLRRDRRRR